MGGSLKIFQIGVTAVRIHPTFFLLLAWIGAINWLRAGPSAALDGVIFIALLFVCVVLHEFGHIWAARRYGIRTPDVTLLPIGGVASLERMPEKPSQEIAVALAGPAVNLVIAAVLIVVMGLQSTPTTSSAWRTPNRASLPASPRQISCSSCSTSYLRFPWTVAGS